MRKTLKRNLSYDDRNHLYYVSLYYDGENGRRVRRTRTYPTMEQAEQVIAEYRRAQLLGGRSAPGDVFMEDWLRYWMDELIKPNCEETTCHGYENILNTHMIPSLGRLCVQDLTPVRVQQYYGELRKKGLANNTIRKHHVLLHAALGAAVRQGIVGANVTCLVTPPAREAPHHRFYDSKQLCWPLAAMRTLNRCSSGCTATGKGGGSRTLNITQRATSPSTRRESLISRTFCASASRSSSPCRASRRSHSTGCATALRASPIARMCRCSASPKRSGTAQHP